MKTGSFAFSSRCLVVDIGNTSTSLARFVGGRISHRSHLPSGLTTPATRAGAANALRYALPKSGFDGALVASVAPDYSNGWLRIIRQTLNLEPCLLTSDIPMPVRIDYPVPKSIGADRLANACGGVTRYGAPLIVADFGTALTFDIVSAEGAYIGGVIAPGLPLMADYLYEKTALLPRIQLGGYCPAIGRSTKGAMKIGARIGYRGIVRETVAYIRQSLEASPHLCATGGYARWALNGLDLPFHLDPDLTLFGLGCIFSYGAFQKRC